MMHTEEDEELEEEEEDDDDGGEEAQEEDRTRRQIGLVCRFVNSKDATRVRLFLLSSSPAILSHPPPTTGLNRTAIIPPR